MRHLLARNINSTVAIPSSFISLLMTFKIGKDRAYKLGLLLRDKYNSFLGDVYYPPNVYARSTWLSRTKMTLQLVLAALYPPVDIQQWNSNISWQPLDTFFTTRRRYSAVSICVLYVSKLFSSINSYKSYDRQ